MILPDIFVLPIIVLTFLGILYWIRMEQTHEAEKWRGYNALGSQKEETLDQDSVEN